MFAQKRTKAKNSVIQFHEHIPGFQQGFLCSEEMPEQGKHGQKIVILMFEPRKQIPEGLELLETQRRLVLRPELRGDGSIEVDQGIMAQWLHEIGFALGLQDSFQFLQASRMSVWCKIAVPTTISN